MDAVYCKTLGWLFGSASPLVVLVIEVGSAEAVSGRSGAMVVVISRLSRTILHHHAR